MARWECLDLVEKLALLASQVRIVCYRWFFLSRDAFVRTNRRTIVMMFVRPSVCLSVRLSRADLYCDHTVHFSADFTLWLYSPVFWALHTTARPPTSSSLFPVPLGIEVGYACAN